MPTKDVTKEYIPAATRKKIPDEDFAGPNRSFPIRSQEDVNNAARLIGHAENPDAVKAAIIRIAKKKGLSIPDSWQTSDKKENGFPLEINEASTESAPFTPKQRVATFKTKFLSDGATSRNKRTYPQEAVNRLISSAQLALETPGSDPLTCYISHGEADNDNSLKLAGKITKVWKSGQDAWANIEMPDTTTGREAATLAKHGFLKTSLRATGAELRLSKSGGMPEVSGEGLKLLGIDFTTTPGIETVTVEDVTLESLHATPAMQDINEIFELPTESLLLEEVEEEEQATPIDIQFVDSDNLIQHIREQLGSPVAQEAKANGHDLLIANKNTVQGIHDRIASLQGRSCAPSTMEAGRKLSQSTMSQLDQAHDATAEILGIECGSSSASAIGDGNDGMDDGDDGDPPNENKTSNSSEVETSNILDNNQSLDVSQEETMTPEEMISALKEAGFTVAPPKTEAEKIQEALDAKLAAMQEAFNAKLEEAKKELVAVGPKPQRQSLVEGNNNSNNGNVQESNPKIYRKGSYLTERLKNMDWAQLADREQPLPDGIEPSRLLQEFGHLYLMKTGYYDQD